MKTKRDGMMRSAMSVTMVIFLSKAVGFVREIIQAAYFGTTSQNDAFVAAYGLFYVPVLLFNSCVTSTLVPLYVEAYSQRGLKTANRFTSNVLNLFAAFAALAGVLLFAFARPLVALIYPGFDAEKLALTVRLTRIMAPSLVFIVLSIVLSSVLNARERYISAQLTGFPLSVACIAASVFFARQYGVEAVAWGVFAAGIMQVLILLPSAKRVFRYRFRFRLSDERFRRLVALALPAILSMAVNELNHLIDRALASGLPAGDMSAMNSGYKLITFITGVLIVPLTTVMFSKMSQRAARHDARGLIELTRTGIEVLTMALLPIIALSVIMSPDMIRFAYMRGAFDENSVAVTSVVFTYYVVGVLGFGLRDYLNRVFHALQDTRTPMVNAAVAVVVNIVLNLILVRTMGVGGLALATSVAGAASCLMLLVHLRRKLGRLRLRVTSREVGKIVVASALCAATALCLRSIVPAAAGTGGAFLRLAICCLPAAVVYVLALTFLRVRQVAFFTRLLRR